MTPERRARLANALEIYAELPLQDGDAVLFLDGVVVVEAIGLASHWDGVQCAHLATTLRATAKEVVLAISRAGGDLLPGDFQLWRDLHEELRDSAIDLHPVQALRAA